MVDNASRILSRPLTFKANFALAVAIVDVCLFVSLSVSRPTKDYWMPNYKSISNLGKYRSAAVSTDSASCAVIGKNILAKNGSAVDAAIAVLLCMGVANPESQGLGGGFLMLIYKRSEKKVYYLDAREVAPGKAHKDMYEGNATLSKLGGLAIAVPGEIAGYALAHNKFGVLPWKELFQPTIRICKEGFKVRSYLAKALKENANDIKRFEVIRNIFINKSTGEVFNENDIIKRPDLAKTLEIIATEKQRAIYGPSELARKFLADLKSAGSIITEKDMQNYTPKMRSPVKVHLRNNMTYYGPSPPGSGALLAFMLQVLSGYPDINADVPRSRKATLLTLHRMIETFKFAYARRMEMEDNDSKEMKELVQNLTSPRYADHIRSLIDDKKTYCNVSHYGGNITIKEDHGTAHMSIIAPNGDAVSVTSTINLYFGSMVMSPSTGILLNNQMDDFSSPNITNYFGVPPGNKNFIRPGKRPMSSMSPSIIVDSNGDIRLTLGGIGGTQITTSVAQTILRNLWLGDDIKKSIDGPRLHHQLFPNYIKYEKLFPQDLLEELQKKGHEIRVTNKSMVGNVMGIARGEDGYLYANADYRKGGDVDGF